MYIHQGYTCSCVTPAAIVFYTRVLYLRIVVACLLVRSNRQAQCTEKVHRHGSTCLHIEMVADLTPTARLADTALLQHCTGSALQSKQAVCDIKHYRSD
jgi:hypothetical protein